MHSSVVVPVTSHLLISLFIEYNYSNFNFANKKIKNNELMLKLKILECMKLLLIHLCTRSNIILSILFSTDK